MVGNRSGCRCRLPTVAGTFKGMKTAIVLLLFAVIGSLFSGLYFVGHDKGHTNRAVIALTIRIGLSVLVFGLLIASHLLGWTTDGRL